MPPAKTLVRALSLSLITTAACGASMTPPADGSLLDAMTPSSDAAAPDVAPEAGDSGVIRASRPERPFECPAAAPIADTFNWAPPHVRRGACSAEQITALHTALDGPALTPAQYRSRIGDACYECAFSDPTEDSTWGAIMRFSPGNPMEYLNTGGCMIATGTSVACGIASNNYHRCAFAACDGCAVPDLIACTENPALFAAGGACEAARAQYRSACRNTASNYMRCYGPDGISYPDWATLIANEICGPNAGQ